jgi:recombination protein RecA
MELIEDIEIRKELKELEKTWNVITSYEPTEFLSTGSLQMDRALGGGWIRGGHSMLCGKPKRGKTTLLMLTLKAALREKKKVLIVDTEFKFREEYFFRSTGFKADKDYVLARPETAEDANRIILLCAKDQFDLIIIDSVGGFATFKEVASAPEDAQMMVRAKFITQTIARIKFEIFKNKVAIIWINQFREKKDQFDEIIRPGGKALEHATSLGIDLDTPEIFYREKKQGKKPEDAVAMLVKGSTWKNDYARNFRKFEFLVKHQPSLTIDRADEIVELAKAFGIFKNKSGEPLSTFASIATFEGEALGKGKDELKRWIASPDNTETALLIEDQIRQNIELERCGKIFELKGETGNDTISD